MSPPGEERSAGPRRPGSPWHGIFVENPPVTFRHAASARLTTALALVVGVCSMPGTAPMGPAACPDAPASCCPQPAEGSCPSCPGPSNRAPETAACRLCQAALPESGESRVSARQAGASEPRSPGEAAPSAGPAERCTRERRLAVRGAAPPVHVLAAVFRN